MFGSVGITYSRDNRAIEGSQAGLVSFILYKHFLVRIIFDIYLTQYYVWHVLFS